MCVALEKTKIFLNLLLTLLHICYPGFNSRLIDIFEYLKLDSRTDLEKHFVEILLKMANFRTEAPSEG